MEQTLGKRIAEGRKRLCLTQEQLAEKLGVTAQAVSKWENDQSCPDISILPQLADIFGTSVDALLGRESTPPPVREVTQEDGDNGWEFSYTSGRRAGIMLALFVLALGGQLLVGSLLSKDLQVWTLLWTTALVIWGIFGIYPKFSFFRVGCLLVGGYAVLDHWQLLPGKLGSELIIPICLVLLGISILVDALKKKGRSRWHFRHNGKDKANKQDDLKLDKESFSYHSKFNSGHQYIHLPLLSYGEVHTNFGDCTVDLGGVEALAPNCTLEAHSNFGDLTLLIPKRFAVRPSTSTNFANITIEGSPESPVAGEIFLEAHASFGDITVQYV